MASTAIMYSQLCRGAVLLSLCANLLVIAWPFVVSSQAVLALVLTVLACGWGLCLPACNSIDCPSAYKQQVSAVCLFR